MGRSLDDWQALLERHFAELSKARRSTTALPIFVLEHPLQPQETQEISTLLRQRLTSGQKLSPHWLLWVVHATEQGYGYDGHEYWDSFEQQTPGWRNFGNRSQLKQWFLKFQEAYNGFEPTGTWAEWFSIIAWPIRHAILPKNLQLQFAEALYSLRYQLARNPNLNARSAGRLLANNAWNASARFSEFLQQEDLAGRIVLALLDPETSARSPIYAPTLKRIVGDLEAVHRAREWLKEVRRTVDQFKGAARPTVGNSSSKGAGSQANEDAPVSAVRPNLLLRRIEKDRWSVSVDLPDFSTLAAMEGGLAQFLKSTRCQILGEDVWHPAGWLLYGAHRVALRTWPSAEQPFVRFEKAHGTLDNILNADFRVGPVPIWLFRIGEDGVARHVVGRTVRPGYQYVIVTRDPIQQQGDLLKPCAIACNGVVAVQLSVPTSVSGQDNEALTKLHLLVNRTIRVWPAGIGPRLWDGDGYSEWLSTDNPAFGISHDHPATAYRLSLDDGADFTVQARAPGTATFVQVGRLPVGRHQLRVRVQRSSNSAPSRDAEGLVTLQIRDPVSWQPGTTSFSGLFVLPEPAVPTLDAFGEGTVSLTVQGPVGRHVSIAVMLTNRRGEPVLTHEIAKLDLPVTASVWGNKLRQFLDHANYAWKLSEATKAVLTVDGDELGRFILKLERESRPLQWLCQTTHHGTQARLLDDSGIDPAAKLFFRSFVLPATRVSLDDAATHSGVNVADPGGLFEAQHPRVQDTLVVSTPVIKGTLQGLIIEPQRAELLKLSPRALLDSAGTWAAARLAGPLASNRRDRVVSALLSCLLGKICGDRWAAAEDAFRNNPGSSLASLDRFQNLFPRQVAGFVAVLRRDYSRMDEGTEVGAKWFAELAKRHGVCVDMKLSAAALRVVSQPLFLTRLPETEADKLIADLSAQPELIHGARLVALYAIASRDSTSSQVTPRWGWR
jgi:hypothetical protein